MGVQKQCSRRSFFIEEILEYDFKYSASVFFVILSINSVFNCKLFGSR